MSTLRILYVCSMELKNGVNGIDNARHRLFVKVKRDLEMLPPTHNAFKLHIKRLNYQAKICKGE